MNNFLFLFSIILSCCFSLSAQLIVSPTNDAEVLVKNIVGAGISSISNVSYVGAEKAIGIFNGTQSNIGLKSGVLMTNGSIDLAIGPNNNNGASKTNGLPGDQRLGKLTGYPTNDASILSFDFVPESSLLSMRIVFASEEYPEYLDSTFDDVIGVFLNSNGKVEYNIAVFGDNIPISIQNINDAKNPQLFVDNNDGKSVQYDEFTTVITLKATVIPYQKNSISFAIADATDFQFDSGLFIEENSFSTKECTNVIETKIDIDTLSMVFNDHEPIQLTQGTPFGGTFFGENVSNNVFNPYSANIGENLIFYTLDSDLCSSIATAKIYVKEKVIPDLIIYNYENKSIQLNNIKGDYYRLEIFNFSGQLVYSDYLSKGYVSIDGTQFKSGWYHVVTTKNGKLLKKNILIY